MAPKVRTHVDYEIFYGLTKALNVGRPIRVREQRASREVGTVARFNIEAQFGFIRGGPEQADHYFKFEQLRFDVDRLKTGDKVSFEARVKYGKLRAENIKRTR